MVAARVTLNRDRVVRAGVAMADANGLEATSMRGLAQELSVTPMALYKHVANREELIDGMVDAIIADVVAGEQGDAAVDDQPEDSKPRDWKVALRAQILAARQVLSARTWAADAIETRQHTSPTVLVYMDALMGIMRRGGLSPDLVHHAMHALSSRMWGLTRDVFPTPARPDDAAQGDAFMEQAAIDYPNIVEMVNTVSGSGGSCDADREFEFSLDLLLDGIEQRHRTGWTPPPIA